MHFIGIGGSGLSAIALVLLERGVQVSGSDRQLSPQARRLQGLGAQIFLGHAAGNIAGADLVVRSSAIGDDNVEVQAARAAGIPVLKRAGFLGQVMQGQTCIAVAGAHGKTTTTAMIAWMLTTLGQDPSYIIGGDALNLGRNAHAGQGAYFVIEADEYDRMFLGLNPSLAIVTNIEHDHPDCYPTPEDFYQAFARFADRLQPGGVLLACADNADARRLLEEAARSGKITQAYSMYAQSGYQARNWRPNPQGGFTFEAFRPDGSRIGEAALQLPGLHNVSNALAALAAADLLGLEVGAALAALVQFQGTGRRFQLRGEARGVQFFDDYAHHPTEIRATLAAARARFPGGGLWAVWQPHTYSRTRTLQSEYLSAFADADHVIVTDVYAAREPAPEDGFSARQLAQQIQAPEVFFAATLESAGELLLERVRPGDIVLVLSAGDADQISGQVLQGLGWNADPVKLDQVEGEEQNTDAR